jgi:glycosyltransferase involved in cell wall biosynthesis
MRIGVDARYICYRRGIGNYIYNLVKELDNIITKNNHNAKLILFVNSYKDKNNLKDQFNANVSINVIPIKFYPIWEQFFLPLYCLFFKIDVLHATSNSGPIFIPKKIKLVQTIHDVMYMLPSSILPKSKSKYQYFGRLYLKFIVPLCVKRANTIITVSFFSKLDIQTHIPIISNKNVAVIYEAAGSNFISREHPLNNNYEVPYFITFGSLDPRKNTLNTISAFKKFISENKLNIKLYIVGLKKDEILYFNNYLQFNNILDNIILCDYLDESELIKLYQNSIALIYISLYEGFGIPILEGMSCKTLIITSKNACIPEIAGENNALFVDALSIEDISNKISIAFFDTENRANIINNASKHVMNFNWEKVANETFNIYISK